MKKQLPLFLGVAVYASFLEVEPDSLREEQLLNPLMSHSWPAASIIRQQTNSSSIYILNIY